MISFTSSGSFIKLETFLYRMTRADMFARVSALAQEGVSALSSATPVRTGLTAGSWDVDVTISSGACTIQWSNSHIEEGVPIAIILQFGHGTGTGGYVQGQDYINPALRPVFDTIADNVWKAVTSA